ncbi:MAG: uracil-DNA glycosylase [bacterium]
MTDDDPAGELRRVLQGLRTQLEWQQACGVDWLPSTADAGGMKAASRPAAPQAAASQASGTRSAAKPAAAAPRTAGLPSASQAAAASSDSDLAETTTLDALRAHIGDCTRCKLSGGRTNLVYGVGSPNADLMFVGEGPGHDEDLKGEPFVGRAGQLLTEIITKGMKLQRADVYIANVVKCRPPNNRNPESDEIATCMPFLQRQIDIIAPRVIVALGTFAAQTLLGVKTPITRMRGTWHDYRSIKVMPTFHPAYLLRTPGDKRLVWEDIKQVMAELGLPT